MLVLAQVTLLAFSLMQSTESVSVPVQLLPPVGSGEVRDCAASGRLLAIRPGGRESQPDLVQIYFRGGGGWTLSDTVPIPGGVIYSSAQYSVALDGHTCVVGAAGFPAGPDGRAWVITLSGRGEVENIQELAPLGPGELFGQSVDVSGSCLAIGAPLRDGGMGFRAGACYIFRRNAQGSHVFDSLLTGEQIGLFQPRFGSSVALDGERIAVASAAGVSGRVEVHARNGAGNWARELSLDPPPPLANSQFGAALAWGGDRLAIGAPAGVSTDGGVFVYSTNGPLAALSLELVRSAPAANTVGVVDRFGQSLVFADDAFLVGDIAAPGTNGITGGAYSYAIDASGAVAAEPSVRFVAEGTNLPTSMGYAVAASGSHRFVAAQRAPTGFVPYAVFNSGAQASPGCSSSSAPHLQLAAFRDGSGPGAEEGILLSTAGRIGPFALVASPLLQPISPLDVGGASGFCLGGPRARAFSGQVGPSGLSYIAVSELNEIGQRLATYVGSFHCQAYFVEQGASPTWSESAVFAF